MSVSAFTLRNRRGVSMEIIKHRDGTERIVYRSKQELIDDLPNRSIEQTFAISGEVFEIVSHDDKLAVVKPAEYTMQDVAQ